MHHITVRADELTTDSYVVEQRRSEGQLVTVYLQVTHVEVGRFVNYSLEDGSERQLFRYVEVTVATTEEA